MKTLSQSAISPTKEVMTTRHRRYYSLQRYILSSSRLDPFDIKDASGLQDPPPDSTFSEDSATSALVLGYSSDPELSMNPQDVSDLFVPEAERGTFAGAGSASSATKLIRKGSSRGASDQEHALCHDGSGYALVTDPFLQHLSDGYDGYVSDPELSSFQEISSLRQHSNGSSSTIDELVGGIDDEAPAIASTNKKQVHRRYFSLHRAGFGSWMDDVVIEESCSQFPPTAEETNLDVSTNNTFKDTANHDASISTDSPKPERRSSLTLMHRRFWSMKKEEMSSNIKAANEIDDPLQSTKMVDPVAQSNPERSVKKKNIRAERAKLHRRWQSLNRDRLIETSKACQISSEATILAEADAALAAPEHNHPLYTNMQSEGRKMQAKHYHSPSILDASTLPPLDERHILTTTKPHMDSPMPAASSMIPELIAEKSPTSILLDDVDVSDRNQTERVESVPDVAPTDTPSKKESVVQQKLHPQQHHRRWQSLYREGLIGNGNSDTQ